MLKLPLLWKMRSNKVKYRVRVKTGVVSIDFDTTPVF